MSFQREVRERGEATTARQNRLQKEFPLFCRLFTHGKFLYVSLRATLKRPFTLLCRRDNRYNIVICWISPKSSFTSASGLSKRPRPEVVPLQRRNQRGACKCLGKGVSTPSKCWRQRSERRNCSQKWQRTYVRQDYKECFSVIIDLMRFITCHYASGMEISIHC